MDILQTIFGGGIASVVWFIVGSILYTNPFVAKIYKSAEGSPGLKKWQSIPKYIGLQSTYPNKLLAVEFVNGTIGSFVIGMVFALVI